MKDYSRTRIQIQSALLLLTLLGLTACIGPKEDSSTKRRQASNAPLEEPDDEVGSFFVDN